MTGEILPPEGAATPLDIRLDQTTEDKTSNVT